MIQSSGENKFVNETEAAEFLGLKRQTLANWRHKRKGPPYHKISTRVSGNEGENGLLHTWREINWCTKG